MSFRSALLVVVLTSTISLAFSQQKQTGTFDVRDFGAVGDGRTIDTKAIQAAVDQCALSGGIVLFPPGTYLTGSIELKSHIELQIQTGAVILGSSNLADYFEKVPTIKTYNNAFLKHSLFYAEGKSHITISGGGTIDGQGANFKVTTREKPARYMNRPYMFRFIECTHLTVKDLSLQNSASWMQHYLACDNVTIRGLKVMNHANLNNDMMDIDGCRNVVISDCIGDTDDDGITLKSTSERITENITISNCVISSHCNAIKAGTESTGGFKNIVINGIVVKPSSVQTVKSGRPGGISGLSLEIVDGGIMEGVSVSNLIIEGPEVPIFVRLGNRGRKHWEGAPQPGVGSIKNISISHINAYNVKSTGCSIAGLPGHDIEGISLSDVRIRFSGGIKIMPKLVLDELADQYPEATMWGTLPSYGFYVRHVAGIRVTNLDIQCAQEDIRPPLMLSDVNDAVVDGLDARLSAGAETAVILENVQDFSLRSSSVRGPARTLFKLMGEQNARISAVGNDLRGIEKICQPADPTELVISTSGNQLSGKK